MDSGPAVGRLTLDRRMELTWRLFVRRRRETNTEVAEHMPDNEHASDQFSEGEACPAGGDGMVRRHEIGDSEGSTLESRGRETAARMETLCMERDRLAGQLEEVASKLDEESRRVVALEEVVAAQEFALERAERTRVATLSRVRQFEANFNRRLEDCRAQRAWKIMLWIRKAYTLFQRRSYGRLARFVLSTPFAADIEDAQIHFPALPDYIPSQMHRAFAVPGGATSHASGARRAPFSVAHPPRSYDILVLSIIDFDFRFQRPQQIASCQARAGHRVFWVSPNRCLPSDSDVPYEAVEIETNIWEVRLRSQRGDIYRDAMSTEARDETVSCLESLIQACGIVEACLYVQLPYWRQVAMALRQRHPTRVLYDCMDDWETFHNIGQFNKEEEAALVRECDVLVVSAERLRRKYLDRGLSPLLVRNAADFDFFNKEGEVSGKLEGIPRPIVGYFGAVAEWMDLDLVYDVARSRPNYSFVLAGGVFDRDVARFNALPNVTFLGQLDYQEMPNLLAGFDVCVIPFLLNEVTNATDPVKLYEYLSQGKPVVATKLSELAICEDLVYLAGEYADFARQIDQAISETGQELERRRIEFAQANTWSKRVETIDGAIRRAFPLVSILIVSHNSADYLPGCFDSIIGCTNWPTFEVILVDNASVDGSAAIAESYASRGLPVRSFSRAVNEGFALGNNLAARQACGEYLILLNADTLVSYGWVGRMYRHLERDSSIGVVAPVTNFAGNELKINADYRDAAGMRRFAESLHAEHFGRNFDIAVAPLFCAMMRRTLWDAIGGLDEAYEIGMFEDDDFSMRVREAGYRVAGASDTFVHHFGQGSFSQLSSEAYQRVFEANRSRFEHKWARPWTPHATRPGVLPASEEERFDPLTFSAGAGGQ
jgi:GT2 family glycosyltransferase/glycosyltransferase involved in cell wall biosynthesis